MKTENKVIAISIMLGLSVCIIDAIIDVFFFYEGESFLDMILLDIPPLEIYMRSLILLSFIIFGLITSRFVAIRIQAENKLKASLREKEILLRELHHRTKNNMQVISSLMTLQSFYTNDETIVKFIKETKSRIDSMALVQQKLYESKSLSHIDLINYINELTTSLSSNYMHNSNRVSFMLDLESVPLSIDKAVPCGLVINELLTNALEHAFPGERKGTIKITLKLKDILYIKLGIEDNGIGVSQDFDLKQSKTLGLQIVNDIVTHQLYGTIETFNKGGLGYLITFKN